MKPSPRFWLLVAAVTVAFVAMFLEIARAHSHSWFPTECCSSRDCALAVGVKRDDKAGAWIMPDGERIPYGDTRPTPEGVDGVFWCRFGGVGKIIVIGGKPCVFVPSAGG